MARCGSCRWDEAFAGGRGARSSSSPGKRVARGDAAARPSSRMTPRSPFRAGRRGNRSQRSSRAAISGCRRRDPSRLTRIVWQPDTYYPSSNHRRDPRCRKPSATTLGTRSSTATAAAESRVLLATAKAPTTDTCGACRGRGLRRTQSFAAATSSIAATQPFHWGGEEATFDALVDDTFVTRMGGPQLDIGPENALGAWGEQHPGARTHACESDADRDPLAGGRARKKTLFRGICGMRRVSLGRARFLERQARRPLRRSVSLVAVAAGRRVSARPYLHDWTSEHVARNVFTLSSLTTRQRRPKTTSTILVAYLQTL